MKIIIKSIFFLFIIAALPKIAMSQEMERALQSNPVLQKTSPGNLKSDVLYADTVVIDPYTMSVNKMILVGNGYRFFDDFSYYYYIKKNNLVSWNYYPDQRLWEDSAAFINTTYASFVDSTYSSSPPSIGTATLDAFNQYGQLYPGQIGQTLLADSLTSRPIQFVDTSTSVYLSFYYEPGGIGDPPDPQDSLVLKFFNPKKRAWFSVWSTPDSLISIKFRDTIIHITGEYRNDGFQFKFENYITYSSGNVDPGRITNCDIWNIDYVYLGANRRPGDTIRDITFVDPYMSMLINPKTSSLTNYESIPWKHYSADVQRAALSPVMRNHIKNLGDSVVSPNITDSVYYPALKKDTAWYYAGLNQTYFDAFRDTVLYDPVSPFDLYTADSAIIQFQSFFTGSGSDNDVDLFKDNDTVYYTQVFSNYYAYDDGSAEMGYGLNLGGLIAYRFQTYQQDTLKAVKIYFNQSLNNVNLFYYFDFYIWPDTNGVPNNTKYLYWLPGLTIDSLTHGKPANCFVTLNLDTLKKPLIPPQIFYIGFNQPIVQEPNSTFLNIGLDKDRQSKGNLLYSTDFNGWTPSNINGALMIRPVFACNGPLNKEPESSLKISDMIYPNPATDKIYYNITDSLIYQSLDYFIYDIYGKMRLSGSAQLQEGISNIEIDLPPLSSGLYFLKIIEGGNTVSSSKFTVIH